MPNEGTYWTCTIIFVRLPNDPHWSMDIRTYDGTNGHTVTSAHGIGMLDEYVLSENLNVHNAVVEGLAVRLEGLSRKFRETQ